MTMNLIKRMADFLDVSTDEANRLTKKYASLHIYHDPKMMAKENGAQKAWVERMRYIANMENIDLPKSSQKKHD